MKKFLVLTFITLCCSCSSGYKTLNRQAAKEYLEPFRTDVSWNNFAKKFIYAPAFHFDEVQGAESYVFTLTPDGGEALPVGLAALLGQGVATSIDALSVGFTIADYDFPAALLECLIIGAVTFVICLAGLLLGRRFGARLAGRAPILGGVVLTAEYDVTGNISFSILLHIWCNSVATYYMLLPE